ncbi:YpmS family protein [Pontibacillus sp. HMF3514]|uniref:YpmS family protein n=1 Tax=Pontibacillus sp. HMF3514 TaxID=2692425 RepID=UPI0013202A27|nr:YpmS family protein [Pontibacillus sp. HMF3514]QHE54013.1 DUF2140 family protein [Pontibacillus sp. HMF3514]
MFKAITIKNKWKWLFWTLSVVNVVMIVWLVALVYLPTSHTNIPNSLPFQDKRAEFTVMSSKENLNQIINSYLTDLSKDSPFNYSVSLREDIELRGTIVAFDKQIPVTMKLTPDVQKNGDMILQVKSITLGRLFLPNNKVLDYIKDHYPMPDWIVVNPDKENIYVAITQMNPMYDIRVRAKAFNVKENQLAFTITVPHEVFSEEKSTWLKKLVK